MSTSDGTTGPGHGEADSSVNTAFTEFEAAFEAWMAAEWPQWAEPNTVFYLHKRAAFRAGFDAGVGFAT